MDNPLRTRPIEKLTRLTEFLFCADQIPSGSRFPNLAALSPHTPFDRPVVETTFDVLAKTFFGALDVGHVLSSENWRIPKNARNGWRATSIT